MRTTFDLPDDLFRALKARAALKGLTMRELVHRLIEEGLRSARVGQTGPPRRHDPPPVIIASRGVPIPALSRAELARLEEEEDEAKHARST